MAEILAICNQKGGVGKTTTAINLAACLAAAEKKTLLIDLDPQGNATTGMGCDKRSINPSIYHVLLSGARIADAVKDTELQFLKLVASSPDLVSAEIELANHELRDGLLRQSLQPIQNNFDYVIMDCPPSLGMITINAMVAASGVIVPVQCEYYAMEGLADLNQTIAVVKERANPNLYVRGIILTMFDRRNNLSHQVCEEIRNHFPSAVFNSVVPRNVRLSEAPSHGRPIILYDIGSPGALSYMSLAQELMANTTQRQTVKG